MIPPHTSFVGRSEELHVLEELLNDSSIVTITGPPGVGKTRVALEFIRAQRAGRFEDSVWYCDLFNSSGVDGIFCSVLSVLATDALANTQREDAVARIGNWLRRCGPALLVLDNFEHLLAHASILVSWVEQAPQLRIVVTSRSLLGFRNETVLPLSPLAVEATTGAIADAAKLFIDRATAVRGSAEFGESQLSTIHTIVQILGGTPLSIEIAASLSRILSPSQIVKELDTLATKAGSDSNHRSIEDSVAWSWNLLSHSEQRALATCSVFRGGFSLDAARAVLPPEFDAIEILDSLCERSLLYVYSPPEAPDTLRFSQYPSVRDFAEHQLSPLDFVAAQDRSAAYYLSNAETFIDALTSTNAPQATKWLSLEVNNITRIFNCAKPTSTVALRAAIVLYTTLVIGAEAAFSLTLLDDVLIGPYAKEDVGLRTTAA